jgi:hypothetical protein
MATARATSTISPESASPHGFSPACNWEAASTPDGPSSTGVLSWIRNLAACGAQVVCNATAAVPLVAPNTLYKPRRTQLDLRLSKTFPVGASAQVQTNLDVYNVLNSSALLNLNETYGPRWQLPVGAAATGNEAMLWGRLVQISGRFSF